MSEISALTALLGDSRAAFGESPRQVGVALRTEF